MTETLVVAVVTSGSLFFLLVLIVLLVYLKRRRRVSNKSGENSANGADNVVHADNLEPAPEEDTAPLDGVSVCAATHTVALSECGPPNPMPGEVIMQRKSSAHVATVLVSCANPSTAHTPGHTPQLFALGPGRDVTSRSGKREDEGAGDGVQLSSSGGILESGTLLGVLGGNAIPGSTDQFLMTSSSCFPVSRDPMPAWSVTGTGDSPCGRAPLARRASLTFSPAVAAPAVSRPPLARRSSLTDAGARALQNPGIQVPPGSLTLHSLVPQNTHLADRMDRGSLVHGVQAAVRNGRHSFFG